MLKERERLSFRVEFWVKVSWQNEQRLWRNLIFMIEKEEELFEALTSVLFPHKERYNQEFVNDPVA